MKILVIILLIVSSFMISYSDKSEVQVQENVEIAGSIG